MAAAEATKEEQIEERYDEAAYVDSQYEYLLKNKDKGITFEEYAKRRGIKLEERADTEYEYLLKNNDKGITEEELEKRRAAKT